MNKNLLIRLAIVLVVIVLSYVVFWFFKVGQVEKQFNKFVNDNNQTISVGQFAVSGFPFSQKISVNDFKIKIPHQISTRKIVVGHLEAVTGIFSSDFVVSAIEGVSTQDQDGLVGNVEFVSNPEIAFSIADGGVSKFHYQDSGYKINDAQKVLIYASAGSNFSIEVLVDEAGKSTTKILVNIRDIQGYEISNFYKNSLEKKIIDGIKTEEIKIGSFSSAQVAAVSEAQILSIPTDPSQDKVNVKDSSKQSASAVQPISSDATADVANKAPVSPDSQNSVQNPSSSVAKNSKSIPNQQNIQTQQPSPSNPVVMAPEQTNQPPAAPALASSDPNGPNPMQEVVALKSNFVLDAEYSSASSSNESIQVPGAPASQDNSAVQDGESLKINNMEFSNSQYKIVVNGDLKILMDDNLPSGAFTVKVEKIDGLVGQFSSFLNQDIEKRKAATLTGLTSSELPSISQNQVNPSLSAPESQNSDQYVSFLLSLSQNLMPVANEIASKNPVSKGDLAQFDVRRQKNLEFVINEVSLREILGKF